MRIDVIYRYAVKGLSPERLTYADLEPGKALPWDRAFALAQGDAGFNPDQPVHLPKSRFMCLMKNASIAGIRSSFAPGTGTLTLHSTTDTLAENALCPDGRVRIAAWLARFLGSQARGTPAFHYLPGFVFGDQRKPVVSLMNIASVAALERACGQQRDIRRFRANIIFSGASEWAEFEWIGRSIRLGTATLRVIKRTDRCPATEVNPDTAERDANPVAELRAAFGHHDLGVHAEVTEAGRITPGARLELL